VTTHHRQLLIFTGGHHTSALAVANKLVDRGWLVAWFGHRHSLWGDTADSAEYRDVTNSHIAFYDLQAGKFYRSLHPAKLLRLPLGFVHALYLLLKLRPAGIVSFGGYLAVPTVICGWLLGIPSITHEQTIVAGYANKILSHFVKKIALTWPQSFSHYPTSKTTITGLPLRTPFPKHRIRNSSSTSPTVYITGGKQGSHILNLAVFGAIDQLTKRYHLIHQTGASSLTDDQAIAKKFARHYPRRYHPFGFDSSLALTALTTADIVVSRAGAHTVYELGILGTPSVLIPIPWSSHNEQALNAAYLADRGLAIVLPQQQLTPDNLVKSIKLASHIPVHPMQLPSDGLIKLVQLIESVFV